MPAWKKRMPWANIKALLLRGAIFILLLAGMNTLSNHSKALQKRFGIFCAWQEPIGTMVFIPFRPFKLTWRLPVSNHRLTAWGGRVQATVTGTDCSGFVSGGARQQSTAETMETETDRLPLAEKFLEDWTAVFRGLSSGVPASQGQRWSTRTQEEIIRIFT